jgi:hypothetical protein
MIQTTIDYDWYYQILELPPGAPLEEIKRNYRKLVRRWHPDRVPESEKLVATEKMKEINEACEILERYWGSNGSPPPSAERQRQEAEARRMHEERLRQEEERKIYEEQLHQTREQRQHEEAQRRAQEEEKRRQYAAALLSPFERKTTVAILLAAEAALFGLLFGVMGVLNSFWTYLNGLHVEGLADLLFNLSALAVYVVLLVATVVGGIASVFYALILAWTLVADVIRGSVRDDMTARIVTFLRSVVNAEA